MLVGSSMQTVIIKAGKTKWIVKLSRKMEILFHNFNYENITQLIMNKLNLSTKSAPSF